jgi:hypothetical protein
MVKLNSGTQVNKYPKGDALVCLPWGFFCFKGDFYMDKVTEKIILNGKIRPHNFQEDRRRINKNWDEIDWSKKGESFSAPCNLKK